MEAIKICGLTKKYGDICAVDGLDLDIHRGEVFGLLGVNGAGKTTTVKLLTCLTKPTSGDALLNGKSILDDEKEVRRMIGVSPQETAVAPMLSVKENLEFMCGVCGMSRKSAAKKTVELTERFGLHEVLHRKAGKLSGGWQRRLSIALSMVSEPEILFLDEPTLGLDVIARTELHELIEELSGDITVVLTTHYMEEAETLCDRVGIMKQGKLLALGTPDELKSYAGKKDFEDAFIAIVREAGK